MFRLKICDLGTSCDHEGTMAESRALFGSNIGRCGHKALKISASDNPGESLFGDGGGAAGGPGRR